MKYLLLSLISLSILAEECSTTLSEEQVVEKQILTTDVPKHLEGAKIIIKLADGRESEVPAEKFKVVPRKQQFLVTKLKQNSDTVCNVKNKNRVAALVGRGPKEGLNRDTGSNQVDVSSRVGANAGVQYQRLLNNNFSVGGQIQSNKSAAVLIGIDF